MNLDLTHDVPEGKRVVYYEGTLVMNSEGSPCLRQIYLPEGVGILAEMCPRVGVLLREGGVSNREIEHFVPLCRERGGGRKTIPIQDKRRR